VGGGSAGSGGSCSLQIPSNVIGSLVQACSPVPWTEYTVNWIDSCPTASAWYEIWYSQPDGSGYVFGWSTLALWSPTFVTGAHARMKIRACHSSGCSNLSSSSFLALQQC